MRKINKVDTRLHTSAYGWVPLVLGLPFTGIGLFFALMGFEITPLVGTAHAPLWVIGFVGLAFALVGLLLVGFSAKGLLNRRRAARARQANPTQPWLADYPWDRTGIADRPHGRWLYRLWGAVFLTVFLLPFNWWAFISDAGHWVVQLVTGLMDLLLIWAYFDLVRRFLAAIKFGTARLSFREFPYRPGHRLTVDFEPNAFDKLEVTLRYVQERFETTGHGKNRSTRHVCYEIYAEPRQVLPNAQAGRLEFSFELPDNAEWTTRLTPQQPDNDRIFYWELVVEAEEPGIDFRASFPLPVYDTRQLAA